MRRRGIEKKRIHLWLDMYHFLAGYKEYPLYTVGASLNIMLPFALLYWRLECVQYFMKNLTARRQFTEALYNNFLLFITGGLGDIHPLDRLGKIVVFSKALVGIIDSLLRVLSEERRAKHQKEESIRKRMGPALAAANSLFKGMLDDAEGCTNELIKSDMSLGIIDERKRRIAKNLKKYAKWYRKFGDEIEQFLDHEDKELKSQLEKLLGYSHKVSFYNIEIIGNLSELINILQPCKNRGEKLYNKLYF
ncbi:MAG: ion channel [Candidatus Methanofastidiosia archaeon]